MKKWSALAMPVLHGRSEGWTYGLHVGKVCTVHSNGDETVLRWLDIAEEIVYAFESEYCLKCVCTDGTVYTVIDGKIVNIAVPECGEVVHYASNTPGCPFWETEEGWMGFYIVERKTGKYQIRYVT